MGAYHVLASCMLLYVSHAELLYNKKINPADLNHRVVNMKYELHK